MPSSIRFAVILSILLLCGAPWTLRAEQSPIVTALQPFVERKVLAGAVTMVASKDEVLSVECVGYADVAAQKPMRTDALFWIASMTKPFTATALMMLVDEGKVKLDDPVEKYMPEFKGLMWPAEKSADHILLKRPSPSARYSATSVDWRSSLSSSHRRSTTCR